MEFDFDKCKGKFGFGLIDIYFQVATISTIWNKSIKSMNIYFRDCHCNATNVRSSTNKET